VSGRVWFVPTAFTGTTRELIDAMAGAAGTKVSIRRVPGWMLRLVGVFSPLLAAVGEMAYQWEVPYVLDDGAFRRTFGVEPTPLDEAIRATLGLPEDARHAA